MKRKILIFLAIVVIALMGFLAWQFLSPYNKAGMFCAIPSRPVFIIETDDSYNAWEKLATSEVWARLRKHRLFADVASGMAMLDTIVRSNEQLAKYVGKRSMVISMHITDKGAYDFIYAVDLRRASKLLTFEKYLKGVVSSKYKIKNDDYKGVPIYRITDSQTGSILSLCFRKNLMIASYNSRLLEASIDQFDKPRLAEDKNFLDIYGKLKGEGLFRIFLNYAQIDDYTNGILSLPDPNIRQLSKTLLYTGLAVKLDGGNLIRCDGLTSFNDTVVSSFRAMMHSGTGKTGLADVLPAKTASAISLQFDRFTGYFDNMMNNLKEVPRSYDEYKANIEKAERFLKIDVRKNLMSWIGNEVAMVHLPPMGLGRSNEFAVFLRARDIDDAKENLDLVMKQIKKRTPVKFEAVEYNGYYISYLSMKGFFKLLLGKYFQKLDKPYFTYIGDYVVFSNHPQTLKVIIDGVTKHSLLANSKEYKDFTDNFSRKSNVFMLVNTAQFLESLQSTMSSAAYAGLMANREYITCFPYFGFQLEKDGRLFKTRFYVDFKNSEKDEDEDEGEDVDVQASDSAGEGSVDTLAALVTDTEKEEISQILGKVDDYIPDDLTKSVYTEKYSNGKTKVEMELKDGFRHGGYTEYYENGEVKVKGQFRRDHKDGTWKLYAENGKLLGKVKFEDGKQMSK
jgi:hypothetical protein